MTATAQQTNETSVGTVHSVNGSAPSTTLGTAKPIRKVKLTKTVLQDKLTQTDSIKLNLISLYPKESLTLQQNVLTQFLHPTEIITAQSDSLSLGSDSTAMYAGADTLVKKIDKDSLITTSKVKERPRAMQEKQLKPSGFNVDLIWLLPVLIVLVAITGWIRIVSGKFFGSIFNAVLFPSTTDNLFKISHFRKSAWSFGLNFLFIANLSLFGYEIMTHFGIHPGGLKGIVVWGVAFIVVLIIYLLKTGVYVFLGWVFNTKNETQKFLFQVNLLNKATGIIFLPIIIVIPYVNPDYELMLIEAGGVLFGLTYIIQMIRGAKIILREPISVFYMILYLCTLEILPIVTLFKIIAQP